MSVHLCPTSFLPDVHILQRSDPIKDKVADFLSFNEARRFVIRLLRQPGVYRFVTPLER